MTNGFVKDIYNQVAKYEGGKFVFDGKSPFEKFNVRQINTYIRQNREEDMPKVLAHAEHLSAQQIVGFSPLAVTHPDYDHFAYKMALEVADQLSNSTYAKQKKTSYIVEQKSPDWLKRNHYDPVDHHVSDEDIKWMQYHLFDTMGSNAYDWVVHMYAIGFLRTTMMATVSPKLPKKNSASLLP